MPGKASRESGITTLKAETLERTVPLHPTAKLLCAPPRGHQTEPSCQRPGQHPTFYLPITLGCTAAPTLAPKSPWAQLRSEPLGACTSPSAHAGHFQYCQHFQRCSALRKGLGLPLAAAWAQPPSSMGSTRVAGPGRASGLTQTSPAMCAQPRPGKNPPAR